MKIHITFVFIVGRTTMFRPDKQEKNVKKVTTEYFVFVCELDLNDCQWIQVLDSPFFDSHE